MEWRCEERRLLTRSAPAGSCAYRDGAAAAPVAVSFGSNSTSGYRDDGPSSSGASLPTSSDRRRSGHSPG
ncbi:hypothetical protein [Paenibacillus thiaminolyticus]|uniref:hypothetical protein n=1 Tax=Paenibacillus thiaminolyticus TaxID=49283 RepID=UPI002175DA6F|nr:hypothetical protein [Paenibacillus thiaminolyticus]